MNPIEKLFRSYIVGCLVFSSAHILVDKNGIEHEDGYYLVDELTVENSGDLKYRQETVDNGKCTDENWCMIPMPSKSLFKFRPPSDPIKWRDAQYRASTGEQVLLKLISKTFTTPYDFLDGDRSFRSLHRIVDVFIDDNNWLNELVKNGKKSNARSEKSSAANQKWYKEGKDVVPYSQDWRYAKRAPIATIGYNAFEKNENKYFSGSYLGGMYPRKYDFLKEWKKVQDQIDSPFIPMCSLNENWGWLSSYFPNRTSPWGSCCYKKKDQLTLKFLDHDKTLMLIINQHSNISHPKILTLPRGLPLTWERTEQLVWDAIRTNQYNKKTTLLFAAASSWGKRPQILKCVSNKFSPGDFEGHAFSSKNTSRLDRVSYYAKLSTAMFGLSLPGLGYDTFRMWELLTMGTIVVIERSVGFDRSLWRLPALLVDDFNDVTPELLRTAYVEAIYRADEFEFERLKQSFWWDVISNVSATRSLQPMLDKFPMEAEERDFGRPSEPYECAVTGTCGPGTKRIPLRSC